MKYICKVYLVYIIIFFFFFIDNRMHHMKTNVESSKKFAPSEGWNENVKTVIEQTPPLSLSKFFRCRHCLKNFKFQSSLSYHMCHKKSNLTCRVCGKTFTRRSSLHDHSRVHSGEKPFECGICKKAFSKKYNLSVHMMRHKRENYF